MATIGTSPIGIIQQISVGGTCAGVAPTGTTTETAHRKIWPAQATGGLFDFGHTQVATLIGFEAVLGGQTVWKLYVTDGVADTTANDVLVAQGTTETTVLLSETITTYLLPGQKLKFVSTGTATSAWRLTAKAVVTQSEYGIFLG